MKIDPPRETRNNEYANPTSNKLGSLIFLPREYNNIDFVLYLSIGYVIIQESELHIPPYTDGGKFVLSLKYFCKFKNIVMYIVSLEYTGNKHFRYRLPNGNLFVLGSYCFTIFDTSNGTMMRETREPDKKAEPTEPYDCLIP